MSMHGIYGIMQLWCFPARLVFTALLGNIVRTKRWGGLCTSENNAVKWPNNIRVLLSVWRALTLLVAQH